MMHGVFIRAFVRSTEGLEKVIEAVKAVDPFLDERRLEVRAHKGVYGNVFHSITYRGGKREALKVWKYLMDNLNPEDREFLVEHVEELVDDWGNLHLRLKKQDAYEGRLSLGKSGVVKVVFRLEAYPAKREKFFEVARRLVDEALRPGENG